MRDRRIAGSVMGAVLIALLAWPVRSITPGTGGDWSWVAGLMYAAEHGLNFGGEIVFTYGPLGFLNTWYGPSLYYADTLVQSWAFTALVQALLAATLLFGLRRCFPLIVAAALTIVVLSLTPDHMVALGFAWCVLALQRDGDALGERVARAFPFAIGALTGIALLGKLNHGVMLLLLALIALSAVPRRRDALACAGALLTTLLVCWLIAGQAIGDLWSYLRYGVETIAGYAPAMGTTDPQHAWAYKVAGALVAFALMSIWFAMRGTRTRLRWGVVSLCVVYAGLTFKEGFVRMDYGHLTVFFGDLIVVFALLPMRGVGRLCIVGGMAGVFASLVAVQGAAEVGRTLNPYRHVIAAGDQLRTIASPSRRNAISTEIRAKIEVLYSLTPRVLHAVGQRTVMFWPYLYGDIAYAYDLNLRPFPSFEPYSSYTPALDRLGARMLASDEKAPARIMRETLWAIGSDGRHSTFETPQSTLEIICRYRQIAAEGGWHVLARAGDRCGTARAIGTSSAAWGQPVPVPPARRSEALVLLGVEGAGSQGVERLTGLLIRPQRRWVRLDGVEYRFINATSHQGLLLSAPPDADYPRPFAMAPNPRKIAVGRDGRQPGGELHYRFVEVAIRPFSRTQ